jgi:segregation and condensation protein A
MSAETQDMDQTTSAWEDPVVEARADDEDALIVDVAGYEGPLDLLLALARTQKVDLSKISVLALADQYLGFIGEAQKLRLELAADYLVNRACCCRARRFRARRRRPRNWRGAFHSA